MKVHYYLISDGDKLMTVLGGVLKPSKRSDHVWITNPKGDPLFEVHRSNVKRTNKKELAKRILEDARQARLSKAAPNN